MVRGVGATLRHVPSLGVAAMVMLMAGCAMVAAPKPPSLKLPQPVTDLTARRVGNTVVLRWAMPKRATDKVLLEGIQGARVCRYAGAGPCVVVAQLKAMPQTETSYTDKLPSALVNGPLRALRYTVQLENEAGRTAGPSNVAVTAAGAVPQRIEDAHARVQENGVVLQWTPTGRQATVRIERRLDEKQTGKKAEVPLEQTLEFSGEDDGRVLDTDAVLDHTYSYVLERVAQVTLDGKPVEAASAPSVTVRVDAKDVFPPATPTGLQAVADAKAHAIDLSWQPNIEADLAGYRVYRREVGSNVPPVRISAAVEPAATFRDDKVEAGKTYAYSVSALDHDGNESARSAEIEEKLPQQ